MNTITRTGAIGAAAIAGAALLLLGCDDGSSSSSGSGTTTTSTPAGNPIDRLADDPKSLYGRSAGYARDVVEDASQSGAGATAIANELAGGGGPVEVGGLTWTAPGGWAHESPANSMRQAQFSVPGGATVYWSTFSGGGSVQANIDRWAGQVLDRSGMPAEPETRELTVGDVQVTIVSLQGTYQDGMPGSTPVERRRWALRGAIVEGPQGTVFIKMTGPHEAVEGAANDFDAMVEGMRDS